MAIETENIPDLLAEVLRRCMGIDPTDDRRQDFGDLNGGALQRPSEVARELLRALSDERLTIVPVQTTQEVLNYGSTLVTMLTTLPANCSKNENDLWNDLCVIHNAEWSTRKGIDLGHCEWIEARMEIVPEWRRAERTLRTIIEG